MQVLLIGRNNIYKTDLPSDISGEYWISDTLKNVDLIQIKANNNVWQAISNKYAKIINPKFIQIEKNIQVIPSNDSIVEKANLKEYGIYVIVIGNIKNIFLLCCLPDNENDLIHLKIKNTNEITIGSDSYNDIIYRNLLVSKLHAKLIKERENWYIENYDSKIGTFKNGCQIGHNRYLVENGDIIFIMGLKIILIDKYLFINNPQKSVNLNGDVFELIKSNKIELELEHINNINNNVKVKEVKNYFSRSPRITNLIEVEKLKIDPPPSIQQNNQKPLILTLGPSMVFGLVSFVTLYSAIDGVIKGKKTFAENLTAFSFPIVSLIGMILFPILYDKKAKERYERKRQEKYIDYLNKKQININNIKESQRKILYQNYISAEECVQLISNSSHKLWERRIEDEDFLSIRLGIGSVPLKLDITFPEESFVMEEDSLVDIFKGIFENVKLIDDAPIYTSLYKNIITSFIFENYCDREKFIKNIIIQLITLHSYVDLNIVFLVDDLKEWEFVRMLPHIWDISKSIRFLADNYIDRNQISNFLEEQIKIRKEKLKENNESNIFLPYYLIITDNYEKIEDLKFFKDFLKIKDNIGIGLVCFTDDFYKLPNECKNFIKLTDKEAIIFENVNSYNHQQKIKLDSMEISDSFNFITQKLANIPIKVELKGSNSLPIRNVIEKLNEVNTEKAKRIPVVPETLFSGYNWN